MKPQALSKSMVQDVRAPVAMAPPVRQRLQSEALLAQTSRRLARSKTALFGLAIVALLVFVSVFADLLARYSPTDNAPNKPSKPRIASTCWGPTSLVATCSAASSTAAGFRWQWVCRRCCWPFSSVYLWG